MVRVGIIGLGVMGKLHMRVLSELDDVEIVAVSDINPVDTKLPKYTDYKNMLKKEDIDAVWVCVPPEKHKKITMDCLKYKKHVFVEKPITHTIKEAQEIIKKSKRIKLMVGHVERFNPVVKEIMKRIKTIGKVYLVKTKRNGPFPKRLLGQQKGVSIDLAVHDVDIVHLLFGGIKNLKSQKICSHGQEIYLNSVFDVGDIKGSSEFSWISPKRERIIEIYGTKGILKGDYLTQSLWFYENSGGVREKDYYKKVFLEGNISPGKIIKYYIKNEEPLKSEDKHFIDCIKKNKKPLVSGADGLKALKVALEMVK